MYLITLLFYWVSYVISELISGCCMNVFTSLAMSCLNVWKREFVFNDVQHHGGCGFTTCHKMMQNLICFRAMPTSVIKFTVIIFGKYARLLSPVVPFIHVLRVCVPIYTYFALLLFVVVQNSFVGQRFIFASCTCPLL